MPCCGQGQVGPSRYSPNSAAAGRSSEAPRTVAFAYNGTTVLTVTGPVTGRQYRFVGHGAALPVDVRDERAVAAVPKLRRVS
ncbi:MAG TPA: hypothetical protein VMS37_11625 [Verrucomicrobiae bacterium]|nr:hypothetical protein [Verrucomicrobiae bacterium]